jgi:hypothetical protein
MRFEVCYGCSQLVFTFAVDNSDYKMHLGVLGLTV